MFDLCHLDGMTRADISESYTREEIGKPKAAYYLDKFTHHLKVRHNMTLKDYCINHLKIEWPKCPVSHEDVGYRLDGKGLTFSQFKRGAINAEHCPAFAAACEKSSKTRKGSGNPMYGKTAWNKGLTAETHPSMAVVSEKMKVRPISQESIEKGRQKKLGQPSKTKGKRIHSDERREWFRAHTARLWQRGVFSKVSSIHVKTREFLCSLPLKQPFVEEHVIGPFSVDFAFPDLKIAIEADGDYYHVNPEFYPNGPETAMQRRNQGRDHAKDSLLKARGWQVWRFWEHHINDGSFKDPLTCKLKQLSLLDA